METSTLAHERKVEAQISMYCHREASAVYGHIADMIERHAFDDLDELAEFCSARSREHAVADADALCRYGEMVRFIRISTPTEV